MGGPCVLCAMVHLMICLLQSVVLADTLAVRTLPAPPAVDGSVSAAEYRGEPSVRLTTGAGTVQVWIARQGGALYVAATMPDSTFYWGDDLVVSLDPDGSGGAQPGDGDRQWYLRRLLDSSVVMTAASGRWMQPGAPAPMLGTTRAGEGWLVASQSSSTSWTIELRISEGLLARGARPRLALRTFNDAPQGWWSWPLPPSGTPAQRVERNPGLWITLDVR